MTPTDIASIVVSSEAVTGPEGLTNREKFEFICYILEVDNIAINDMFDYDLAIKSASVENIQAANFLSGLQWEWSTRCHVAGLVGDDEHQVALTYLTVSRAKLRWAYSFLVMGREPPPYPFIN